MSAEDSSGIRALPVAVDCEASDRGEPAPRAFAIGTRRLAVAEVLDRWLAPDHRYFKLRGDDGDTYILRHDMPTGAWELIVYARARC